jgi:hypothetical protein
MSSGLRSVSRPEKRIFLCAKRNNAYLVKREVREIVRSVTYLVRLVVNATTVLMLVLLAAVPVYSLCLLINLYAAFKSYKMLSVHTWCQSRS